MIIIESHTNGQSKIFAALKRCKVHLILIPYLRVPTNVLLPTPFLKIRNPKSGSTSVLYYSYRLLFSRQTGSNCIEIF